MHHGLGGRPEDAERLRLRRKCGTSGCTLVDNHSGLCTSAIESLPLQRAVATSCPRGATLPYNRRQPRALACGKGWADWAWAHARQLYYVLRTAIESYYHSNRASRGVGGCSAAERAYYVIIVSVVLSFLTVVR